MRSTGILVEVAFAFAALAACGDAKPATPDAAAPDAPAPDSPPSFPACDELVAASGVTLPAHVTGMLSEPDLISPESCTSVDAPYGIESAGPDAVVKLEGLVAGAAYVVRISAQADLGFYVVTGCTTPSGPSASECLLFEDATSNRVEVGSFVATGPTAYVIVDYWESHTPADQAFTLDAYREECSDDAQCGGATPTCDAGKCVECATSFDCTTGGKPSCDMSTNTCIAGSDACLVDDTNDPANDGPAGAAALVPNAQGDAVGSGQICATPLGESDFFKFTVGSLGEVWDFTLNWSGTRDLDIELYDASGDVLGLSYWEHGERARLTYLPLGTYYVRVTEFTSAPNASSVNYTLSAHRALGTGCTSSTDCAADYRNQIYRGSCQAGACIAIDGNGAVTEGGACDSQSDCADNLSCPSFFFVANASTRDVCARGCSADADCAPLGGGYVCTTYLTQNFCVQKCTNDQQCPTAIDVKPPSGQPWYRLSCELTTGRCRP